MSHLLRWLLVWMCMSSRRNSKVNTLDCIETHTRLFNGPLSRTTRVSRYQKSKTNQDFTEARDSEWQWHQLGHIQVCTSLQTDNYATSHHSVFYRPDALLPPNQQRQSTEGTKLKGTSLTDCMDSTWKVLLRISFDRTTTSAFQIIGHHCYWHYSLCILLFLWPPALPVT